MTVRGSAPTTVYEVVANLGRRDAAGGRPVRQELTPPIEVPQCIPGSRWLGSEARIQRVGLQAGAARIELAIANPVPSGTEFTSAFVANPREIDGLLEFAPGLEGVIMALFNKL